MPEYPQRMFPASPYSASASPTAASATVSATPAVVSLWTTCARLETMSSAIIVEPEPDGRAELLAQFVGQPRGERMNKIEPGAPDRFPLACAVRFRVEQRRRAPTSRDHAGERIARRFVEFAAHMRPDFFYRPVASAARLIGHPIRPRRDSSRSAAPFAAGNARRANRPAGRRRFRRPASAGNAPPAPAPDSQPDSHA